jgi:hypothetical protein
MTNNQTRPSRRPLLIAAVPVAVVLAVLVTLVVVKLTNGTTSPAAAGPTRTALPATVVDQITTLSQSTLDTIGAPSGVVLPTPVVNGPPLTLGGVPEVLYIGAEYCPFCAAERWALTEALSRFGSFSGLGSTHSATQDVYPNTQTLSYYGSSFTSPYLAFVPVETTTNQPDGSSYTPLQPLTAGESTLLATYDRPPYSSSSGGIPFIDIANKWIISGASFDPGLLGGQSLSAIATALGDPSSPIAAAVDGAANVLTAAMCDATGSQPVAVCQTPGVAAAQRRLATKAA